MFKKRMTAKEFLEQLEKDPEYQKRDKTHREERKKIENFLTENESPAVNDLRNIGFPIESVWDFVNSKENYYLDAVPLLIKHLKKPYHPKVIDGIARSLAIPELEGNSDLWDTLEELYKKTPPDTEISIPLDRGSRQGIALALKNTSDPTKIPRLKSLLKSYPDQDCDSFLKEAIKYCIALKKIRDKYK